jgi:hypothetical protein
MSRGVISGLRRVVNEFCSILGYYAAYSGNYVPRFRDNLSVPSSRDFLTFEDETYKLSPNAGMELPLYVA